MTEFSPAAETTDDATITQPVQTFGTAYNSEFPVTSKAGDSIVIEWRKVGEDRLL